MKTCLKTTQHIANQHQPKTPMHALMTNFALVVLLMINRSSAVILDKPFEIS